MQESLMNRYIKERKIVDAKFKEDFDKEFEKFKQNDKMYQSLLNDLKELQEEHKRSIDGSNAEKCSCCGMLFAEEELDEETKECFYCKVFLKHDIIKKEK